MNLGKISLAAAVLLSAILFGGADAKAEDPNMMDIWHYNSSIPTGELVDVKENSTNVKYIEPIGDLRICGIGPLPGDPNDNKLILIGINNNGRNVVRLALSVDQGIPDGTDRVISINYCYPEGLPSYGPLTSQKRNIFIIQHPNDPNDNTPDPNKYDVLDLTDHFTKEGIIDLPPVTSSTPRDQVSANWYFITSNYADLHPKTTDGLVNFQDFARLGKHWKMTDCNSANKWCEYADLERDGNVDYNDVDKFNEQWLVDANSIR